MTIVKLLRQRLTNQQLAHPRYGDPTALVAWLGAVQAQDYYGAKWALGLRLPGATDAALEAAFNAGAILRTHVLRPTWHFVAPADIRWLLALTAPRVKQLLAPYGRLWGIDSATRQRSQAVLTQALRDGQALTRTDLVRALQADGLRLNNLGLGHVVMHAELDGLIVSGPRRGKQFTYMLLEARVPPATARRPDEALAELVRRYFTSHGPAQIQDFVWWSSLTAADARQGLAALGSELARENVDGKDYWYAPAPVAPQLPRAAHLLPNYDEYAVAYRDRDAFFDPAHAARLDPRLSSPFSNVILIGGRVAGFWKRTVLKAAIRVELRWLSPPSDAARRSVGAAAGHYREFMGVPVLVSDKEIVTHDPRQGFGAGADEGE